MTSLLDRPLTSGLAGNVDSMILQHPYASSEVKEQVQTWANELPASFQQRLEQQQEEVSCHAQGTHAKYGS